MWSKAKIYFSLLYYKKCLKWTKVFIIHLVQFMYLDREVHEENQSGFQALKTAREIC